MQILKLLFRFLRHIRFVLKKPFYYLRKNHFGKGCYVANNVDLRKCFIGDYSYIGPNCSLNCCTVGNYCSFAPNICIGGEEHSINKVSTSDRLNGGGESETITQIGNDVWIGAQCYIRMGVKIGDGAVVGANSFVNKDIPPYAIVFGSPAKIYKYRFDSSIISQIQDSRFWFFKPEEAKKIINNLSIKV